MTISNYDGIINARANNPINDVFFTKITAFGGVSGMWYSSFHAFSGTPIDIYRPAVGSGGVFSNVSTGAIPLTNPNSGNSKYLLTVGLTTPSVSGFSAAMLVDLVWLGSGLSPNSTSAQSLYMPSTPVRYYDGTGLMLAFASKSGFVGGIASNITVNYTNNSGTAGRVSTQAAVQSIGIQRLMQFGAGPFFPLAGGDGGIRSIQSITFSASMGNTALLDVLLVKPLAMIPTIAANTFVERDSTAQIDGLTPLPWGSNSAISCLGLFLLTGGTTTTTLVGFMRTCEG